jgi:predicted naringenin-chalcone synthase
VAGKVVRALPAGDRQAPLVRRIYDGSKIAKRHSVVEDYANETLTGPFLGDGLPGTAPGMSRRNALYKEKAPALAHAAAVQALSDWGGSRDEVTHVIAVSCTGVMAPGVEFLLVDSLGLSRTTQRLGINFMGCFGAFKGLAVAKAMAAEDPSHRVLVVCTELCSLHFHLDGRLDTHVANAIFADGASAVVVGCVPRKNETPRWGIVRQQSVALEATHDLMTWEATDGGLVMRLSAEVPGLIERHVAPFARALLGGNGSFADCDWALHPGGKAILEAVTRACALAPEQTTASWDVLRDYGNMSSATFLFVLDRQSGRGPSRKYTIGLGFGPGLSMEGILLKRSDA